MDQKPESGRLNRNSVFKAGFLLIIALLLLIVLAFAGYKSFKNFRHSGLAMDRTANAQRLLTRSYSSAQLQLSQKAINPNDSINTQAILKPVVLVNSLILNTLNHSSVFLDDSIITALDSSRILLNNFQLELKGILGFANRYYGIAGPHTEIVAQWQNVFYFQPEIESILNINEIEDAIPGIFKSANSSLSSLAYKVDTIADEDLKTAAEDFLQATNKMTDAYTDSLNIYHLTSEETFKNYFHQNIAPVSMAFSMVYQVASSSRISARTSLIILFILTTIIIMISIFIILFYYIKKISTPLKKLSENLSRLSLGEFPKDEMELKYSPLVNKTIQRFQELLNYLGSIITFAEAIEKSNFDQVYELKSKNDHLGKSLTSLKEGLIKNKLEMDERAETEKQQTWISKGTAHMAEILNQSYSSLEDFSFQILKNLVNYLSINQGGFYIFNDNSEGKQFLELSAAFAYNRRKFLQKEILPGEGYVGSCIMEKKYIYRTNLPEDYIKVTSGLGDAPPRVLLAVPLLIDEEIYGALELASFNEIPEYQIEFVQRISETIATTLSNVKNRERTEQLLKESREQAEKIAQTEEEMRQNLEEMQATQEESARREQLLNQELKSLKSAYDDLKSQFEKLKNQS